MKTIDSDLLDTLTRFSKTINLGVIAIADDDDQKIVFASKLKALLGYDDDDLVGIEFNRLLPPSIRARHVDLMNGFKAELNPGTSRQMASNRKVQAIAKNGDTTAVSVAISYHPQSETVPGIFVALLQDPLRITADGTELRNLQDFFSSLLAPGQKAIKQARHAIAQKIAASGGIIGFLLWLLTQVTPFGSAVKGAIAGWDWDAKNKNTSESAQIKVYEKVTPEERKKHLHEILGLAQRVNFKVIVAGYYKLDQVDGFGESIMTFVTSTAITNGDYIFLEDQALTIEELQKLKQHECLIKGKLGRLIDRPNQPKINGIICPTWTVEQYKGLNRAVVANISAIGFAPDTEISLEPFATYLWQFSPSLENLTR